MKDLLHRAGTEIICIKSSRKSLDRRRHRSSNSQWGLLAALLFISALGRRFHWTPGHNTFRSSGLGCRNISETGLCLRAAPHWDLAQQTKTPWRPVLDPFLLRQNLELCVKASWEKSYVFIWPAKGGINGNYSFRDLFPLLISTVLLAFSSLLMMRPLVDTSEFPLVPAKIESLPPEFSSWILKVKPERRAWKWAPKA